MDQSFQIVLSAIPALGAIIVAVVSSLQNRLTPRMAIWLVMMFVISIVLFIWILPFDGQNNGKNNYSETTLNNFCSCQEIKANNPNATSGQYEIYPDCTSGGKEMVNCDMQSDPAWTIPTTKLDERTAYQEDINGRNSNRDNMKFSSNSRDMACEDADNPNTSVVAFEEHAMHGQFEVTAMQDVERGWSCLILIPSKDSNYDINADYHYSVYLNNKALLLREGSRQNHEIEATEAKFQNKRTRITRDNENRITVYIENSYSYTFRNPYDGSMKVVVRNQCNGNGTATWVRNLAVKWNGSPYRVEAMK